MPKVTQMFVAIDGGGLALQALPCSSLGLFMCCCFLLWEPIDPSSPGKSLFLIKGRLEYCLLL